MQITCADGDTCYSSSKEAMDCMASMPLNKSWATATVDVITQSLANYGFLALYHNTGPPYITSIDIMKKLSETQSMIDNGKFSSDMDFQEHIQDLIQITQDAHTRYQKPVCYNGTKINFLLHSKSFFYFAFFLNELFF